MRVCNDTFWSDSCCISMAARVVLLLGFTSATFSSFVLIMNQLHVTFCALEHHRSNLPELVFTTSCVGYKMPFKGHVRLKRGIRCHVL